MNFETTIIRCLNYWKKQYIPTYIGLRALLEKKTNIDFLEKIILRKLEVGYKPVLHKYKTFKKIKTDSSFEYRNFYALSPFSALCEAVVLDNLQQSIPDFSSRVFSYLKPSNFEGNYYKYYFSGYNRRNKQISELLISNNNLTVNVFDISNYYPSINVETCINKLDCVSNKFENMSLCIPFLKALYSVNDGALVGPALSSLLGTLALSEFDEVMEKKHGNYYFRYVDDIIVLSQREEVKSIKKSIEDLLIKYGFKTNQDKYCFGNAEDWLRYNSASNNQNPIKGYYNRLRLYLYRHEEKYLELKENLYKNGFTIPLYKYKSDILYVRLLKYLYHLIFKYRYLKKYYFRDTIANIIQEGKNIRDRVVDSFIHLLVYKQPLNMFQEKLFKSKFNYSLNQLLSFTTIDKYPKIISDFQYFISEERAKMISILKDVSLKDIFPYANSSANWIAMILKDKDIKIRISEKEIVENSDYLLELLACYGVIEIDQYNNLDKPLWYKIVCLSGKRILNDLSYLDEMDVLLSSYTNKELSDFMEKRYNKHEEFYIAFLNDDYYNS